MDTVPITEDLTTRIDRIVLTHGHGDPIASGADPRLREVAERL